MNQFVILEFHNPIKNRTVMIRSGAISGFDYDGANKVNIIYTPGGVFPVQESLEEIRNKLEALNRPDGQGEKSNGNHTGANPTIRQTSDFRKREASTPGDGQQGT